MTRHLTAVLFASVACAALLGLMTLNPAPALPDDFNTGGGDASRDVISFCIPCFGWVEPPCKVGCYHMGAFVNGTWGVSGGLGPGGGGAEKHRAEGTIKFDLKVEKVVLHGKGGTSTPFSLGDMELVKDTKQAVGPSNATYKVEAFLFFDDVRALIEERLGPEQMEGRGVFVPPANRFTFNGKLTVKHLEGVPCPPLESSTSAVVMELKGESTVRATYFGFTSADMQFQ